MKEEERSVLAKQASSICARWRSCGMLDNGPCAASTATLFALCLKRFDEAAAVFARMLRMNPSDNQGHDSAFTGARSSLHSCRDRRAWKDGGDK